jgi:hypothetical protein
MRHMDIPNTMNKRINVPLPGTEPSASRYQERVLCIGSAVGTATCILHTRLCDGCSPYACGNLSYTFVVPVV